MKQNDNFGKESSVNNSCAVKSFGQLLKSNATIDYKYAQSASFQRNYKESRVYLAVLGYIIFVVMFFAVISKLNVTLPNEYLSIGSLALYLSLIYSTTFSKIVLLLKKSYCSKVLGFEYNLKK